MDYRKTNAPTTTVTRDMMELCEDTGNVYESVAIIGKRANQISVDFYFVLWSGIFGFLCFLAP